MIFVIHFNNKDLEDNSPWQAVNAGCVQMLSRRAVGSPVTSVRPPAAAAAGSSVRLLAPMCFLDSSVTSTHVIRLH